MSKHVTISPSETADRLAIRELVDAYAVWIVRHSGPRITTEFYAHLSPGYLPSDPIRLVNWFMSK
jgi:hypothetical protein